MGKFFQPAASAGLAGVLVLSSCGSSEPEPVETGAPEAAQPTLPDPGSWRAALESPGGPITFGLELEVQADGNLRAALRNGVERRQAGWVHPVEGGVVFEVPPYRSRMVAEVRDGGRTLAGRWERDRGEGFATVLPFAAVAGEPPAAEARLDDGQRAGLAGRWRVDFTDADDDAVGIFEVSADGRASGTFLTTLGDYRYLDGRFDGTVVQLCCFDGAHAFLFSAELGADGTLAGDFWSRDAYHDTWTAVKDPSAELRDDFALTRWQEGVDPASLRFRDLEGDLRALDDPAFGGDARLLVVFGTWCPNCNDLTELLVRLDAEVEGLSILGLAFELGTDPEVHRASVRDYMAHHGATWPVLIGGTADKAKASEALPILDRVRAYPTTVFMDGDGEVNAVHTGFSGPATGERHLRLVERFEALIAENLGG